ncbi:high mobility group nucleosome-binding domain-containing protein 5-like [Musca vetustissima]|uniref:high mobility group nucleosome-binding domain-containing protein 5-like n=1 Tax=Musca vetustissima TaxID=27455 RepID=UPI002AB5E430|nr:high mobility group nucleosome-binding domain-containing protein 5-like [Musca vetustissima]
MYNLSQQQQQHSASFENSHEDEETEHDAEEEEEEEGVSNSAGADESVQGRDLTNEETDHELEEVSGQQSQESSGEQHDDEGDHEDSHDQELEDDKSEAGQHADDSSSDKQTPSHEQHEEEEEEEPAVINSLAASKEKSSEIYEGESHNNDLPGVEVRLKQISQEVEKRTSEENRHIPSLTPELDDIGHQSFLSLTDLIRTLRPNDKQIIPQIDSDYSNAMRVLGEKSVVVSSNGNNSE